MSSESRTARLKNLRRLESEGPVKTDTSRTNTLSAQGSLANDMQCVLGPNITNRVAALVCGPVLRVSWSWQPLLVWQRRVGFERVAEDIEAAVARNPFRHEAHVQRIDKAQGWTQRAIRNAHFRFHRDVVEDRHPRGFAAGTRRGRHRNQRQHFVHNWEPTADRSSHVVEEVSGRIAAEQVGRFGGVDDASTA